MESNPDRVDPNDASRRKAEQVFQQAVDLRQEDRSSYLMEHCGAEPALREEVEQLLAGLENQRFVSFQAIEALDEAEGELVDRHIGPYKVLKLIGEGGFGSVYLAEQEKPVRRRVALKVIKLGMDTKQVIARFEAERQALAMMEHAHIAKVFDAGATETGRPYFVMELVKGLPLTEYCNRNRLSTRQRLELFTQVCRAVQHAHQKGVIHRDLKPSNVLVALHDHEPVPKIIDFGIAKAMHTPLTDKSFFTSFRQFVGTPEYVSPEQAEMSELDVDMRSDIYSLGVLLYELLTGATPFDSTALRHATYSEILQAIREQALVTPSRRLSMWGSELPRVAKERQTGPRALNKLLRGDLDWIVMKALEKDRTRRYETAAALAADIERHLNNESVLAGPPSALYRFRKAAVRHKHLFGFIAALFVLVTCFGIWMSLLYAQAERARSIAEANLIRAQEAEDRAKAEADFMHELLASVDPSRAQGREITVRYVLDEASRRIDEGWLEDHPEVQAAVRLTVGKTYYSLGLYATAQAHLAAAEEAHRRLLGGEHPDTLRARCALALVRHQRGDSAQAEALLRSTLEAQSRVLGPEHADTLSSMNTLGTVLRRLPGRGSEAESIYRSTLNIQRRVLGDEHIDTLSTTVKLGTALALQRKLTDAEPLLRHALQSQRRILGDDHPDTATTMNNLAYALEEQGKYAQAEILYRQSLDLDRRVLGKTHVITRRCLNNLVRVLRTQGKTAEMRDYVVEQIARERELASRADADVDTLNSYAWMLLVCEPVDLRDANAALAAARRAVELTGGTNTYVLDTLGRAYQVAGDLDQAVATQRQAVAVARAAGMETSMLEYVLIEYLWRKGEIAEAVDLFRDSLKERRAQAVVSDGDVADSLYASAQELLGLREYELAEPLLRLCRVVQENAVPAGRVTPGDTSSLLGRSLIGQRRFDEAEQILLGAYDRIATDRHAGVQARHPLVERIIELYDVWGKPAEAAEWRSKAAMDEDR